MLKIPDFMKLETFITDQQKSMTQMNPVLHNLSTISARTALALPHA